MFIVFLFSLPYSIVVAKLPVNSAHDVFEIHIPFTSHSVSIIRPHGVPQTLWNQNLQSTSSSMTNALPRLLSIIYRHAFAWARQIPSQASFVGSSGGAVSGQEVSAMDSALT